MNGWNLKNHHISCQSSRSIERKGHHETAQRLRAFASRVFRYAFATLRTERNPADILRGALTVPRVKHHAAILNSTGVGQLLRDIDSYTGRAGTRIDPASSLKPQSFKTGEIQVHSKSCHWCSFIKTLEIGLVENWEWKLAFSPGGTLK